MQTESNNLYATFNFLGVITAYGMLALSIWLTDIPLSAKGFWGRGVLLLTLSLVNCVKYRTDERQQQDKLTKLELAKTDKIIEEFGIEKV